MLGKAEVLTFDPKGQHDITILYTDTGTDTCDQYWGEIGIDFRGVGDKRKAHVTLRHNVGTITWHDYEWSDIKGAMAELGNKSFRRKYARSDNDRGNLNLAKIFVSEEYHLREILRGILNTLEV